MKALWLTIKAGDVGAGKKEKWWPSKNIGHIDLIFHAQIYTVHMCKIWSFYYQTCLQMTRIMPMLTMTMTTYCGQFIIVRLFTIYAKWVKNEEHRCAFKKKFTCDSVYDTEISTFTFIIIKRFYGLYKSIEKRKVGKVMSEELEDCSNSV